MSVVDVTRTTSRTSDGELERLRALVRELELRNEQLERALQSRILIEQAKGVLAERLQLAPDEGFTLLRRAARNNRLRLHDVAAAVVRSSETPAELAVLLPPRA